MDELAVGREFADFKRCIQFGKSKDEFLYNAVFSLKIDQSTLLPGTPVQQNIVIFSGKHLYNS